MGQNLRCPNIQLLNGTVLINGQKDNLLTTKKYILKDNNDVFSGIGTLTGDEYCIKLKKDLKPTQHPPRLVPVKLKPAYKEELWQLCCKSIITPVWEHTEWTNPIGSVRKANDILRLWLDPKDLNKNTESNQYCTRTIDNLSAELLASRCFTLMEARSGYWMVWLDKESPLLRMFNIPWQKFSWLWLLFGLSVSPDVFQERLCCSDHGSWCFGQGRWWDNIEYRNMI